MRYSIMNEMEILRRVDHTMIKPAASWEDIKRACDEAMSCNCATVVVPNVYVRKVKLYTQGMIKIDTLAGFPYGYNTTESKCYEAAMAIKDGADEIDMVASVCNVKNERYDYVLNELKAMREVCQDKVLKVIIETCLLTDDEKIKLCELVSEAGCDYIKTSTGFVGQGATPRDVKLLVDHVSGKTKVKASGGIDSFEQAGNYLKLGADRIGASRLVAAYKKKIAAVSD